jgi:MarR family transcriptional regulator for hemolysin
MRQGAAREQFGFVFSVVARQWRRAIDRRLALAGLTDASWAPLVHLHRLGDGITQKELAARVGTDGSSLVRLLDILERRRLIARRVDREDRRARLIVLTEAGRREVARIQGLLAQAEAEMLEGFADAEIDGLLAALGRLSARLKEIDRQEADPAVGRAPSAPAPSRSRAARGRARPAR